MGHWVVAVCVTVRDGASGEARERGGCLGVAGTLKSSQAVLTPGGGGEERPRRVVAVRVTVSESVSGEPREREGCLGVAGTLRSSQAVLILGGGGGLGGLGGGGVCNGA